MNIKHACIYTYTIKRLTYFNFVKKSNNIVLLIEK